MLSVDDRGIEGAAMARLSGDFLLAQRHQGFVDMWRKKRYSDVTLLVGDEEFRSHRFLLAMHCTYFRDLPNFEKLKTVTFKNLEPDVLNNVLMYLYLADVEVPLDQVKSMMEAAEILGFEALRRQCKYALVSAQPITPANCLEVWPEARQNDDQNLSSKALKVALEFFSRLQHGPSYKQLSYECIQEYLSHPDLKVTSLTH